MCPVSNQPSCFFATAKTRKFNTIEEITVDHLKLCSIIHQTGTCMYNTSKIVTKYLIRIRLTQMNMKIFYMT